MFEVIFIVTIISFTIPIYVYVGYPAVLLGLTSIGRKVPVNKSVCFPTVTLVVSCYNEAAVIEEKVANVLALCYPKELLTVLFVSDGSDDGTDLALSKFSSEGIQLIRQEGRLGKTSGINLAMESVVTEIVVFSDANAMYQPDAITQLVSNFNDATVGYVVGAAIYTDGKAGASANSENSYWQYELKIKQMESEVGSVVGGDGAIYAIRSSLFEIMEATDINDFVNPLQIIAKGYRGVFEAKAICFEETAGDFSKEAKRKERIVNRSFNGLMRVKAVLNPLKVGFFSFQIISHKLLRWLMPYFLFSFAAGSILLSFHGSIVFNVVTLLGATFCWWAMIGGLMIGNKTLPGIFFYPYYFAMVNISAAKGVARAIVGDVQVTWSSHREKDCKKGGVSNKFSPIIISLVLLVSCIDAVNSIMAL